MRRFRLMMKLLGTGGVLCAILFLSADVLRAQPPEGGNRGPGGGGPGGGGRGFGRGGGFGDPTLSRELRDDAFALKINLTEDQKQRLTEVDAERTEYFTSLRGGGGGGGGAPGSEEFQKRMADMQAKLKEFDTKAVDILTPEQKTIWEERKAEKKAEQATRDAGRGQGRPDTGRPRGDGAPAATTEPQAPARRTVFSTEKPPEGVVATASFGATSAAGASAGGATGGGASSAAKGEATLSFNFRYAPWADVLKLFAEAANLTLDLNDVPPGTFNYYDEKTYTVTEALDVMNGYLLPKGFVLIRRDRFMVSLNIDNGIPPSMLPTITVDELPKRGANELLIVDVPLEGFEADKIVGEVKELIGPWGKVAAMKNTNSLNIMDTGSNITRIIRLLKAGSPVSPDQTSFRAIPLKYLQAADAERTIRRLFGLNPVITTANQPQLGFGFPGAGFPGAGFPGFGGNNGRGGDGRGDFQQQQQQQQRQQPAASTSSSNPSEFFGKIHVTADTRTNHLLVTSKSAYVKVVEDAVKSIDVKLDNEQIVDNGPVFLKAHAVVGGDVTQISQTINSMMPGLVVGVDARSSKIQVQATQKEHSEIEKVIQALSGDATGSVAVINLTRLDPIQATNTLRNLFTNEARAPMIEADALGRRLLIRGTADQLAQVKLILQQLGETGPNPQDAKGDRGTVRQIPLNGHIPAEVIPLMQQMWGANNPNKIRVVVPSQPSPVRDRRVPSTTGTRSLDSEVPAGENLRENRAIESARPTGRRTVPTERSVPTTQSTRRPSILQVSHSGERRQTEAAEQPLPADQNDELDNRPNSPKESKPEPKGDKPTQKSETQKPISQEQESEINDEPVSKEPVTQKPATQTPASQDSIGITVLGDNIILGSQNKEALDQFEDMANQVLSNLPVRTRWTIFYLRTADATETAQMLERLFPQSSVTASTSSANSGLFGTLTSGLSNVGRGMMNSTGLNQTLGGSNSLRIITDIRANALFVTGPSDQIAEVESMLELLDASQLPASLRDRVPRTIPVEHADVEDVAAIVEDVFKDAMTPENQQGQGQRMNPLAMLMGGGGGAASGRKEPTIQLTVGVDRRTSHLIVACNDNLFRQIEGLVQSIDDRARDARQTVEIMHLESADPSLVTATLTSLIPKVTITASRGGSRRKQDDQPQAQPQPGQAQDADLIRRMQQRNAGATGGQPNIGGAAGRPNAGAAGRPSAGGAGRQNGGAGGGARPNGGGGGGAGARPGGNRGQ